jgi:outer membrane protein TolC
MERCDAVARGATPAALAIVAAGVLLSAGARAESLSLAEAVRRAIAGTAAVQTAGLKMEEAEARVNQARGNLLPELSGAAGQSERTFNLNTFGIPLPPGLSNPAGPVEGFDARLRVTQSLVDPASWGRLRSARAGVGVTLADSRAAAQQAAQSAALAYVRAARAAATVRAREADLEIASQLDTLATSQLQAGAAANIDVLRARTQTVTAKSLLLVARNELERSLIDLARSLGADPGVRFDLVDSLSGALTSDAPDAFRPALDLALQRRSDLQGEQARLARARAERGAISAERLPRLEASADVGASGLRAPDALQTHQFGVQLTWPLFDGLRREERIHEQSLVVREAEVRAHDLAQQVTADVEANLLAVASGREQEAVAHERLGLAEQELAEARLRFVNGVAGNIEVINAQASLVRAHDADIEARTASAIARVNLARAVGVAETVR